MPTWPLDVHHETLVRDLARVLALGGAWRFLRGPVVAASTRDYPEAWDEKRATLARVVGRTLWHAHLDVDAVLEDAREPADRARRHLRETKLELANATETGIELTVTSIGNDDVAGIVAHEIGRAYVARLAGADHPFRTTQTGLPDAATGSVATVALGLGVVALNAAHYDRSAGETRGNMAYHEHQIASAGGLPWQDLAFLVAVQATVRDDVLSALDTLRPSQAAEVAAWCEVLDDHEDELLELLAPGDVTAESAPPRAAAPREVAVHATFDEADLGKGNLGRPVFRYYAGTQAVAHGFLGLVGGMALGVAGALIVGPGTVWLAPMGAGVLAGAVRGRRKRLYRCATCRSFITKAATQCGSCGGHIAGEIKHPNDRLAAEEELEQTQRAEPR